MRFHALSHKIFCSDLAIRCRFDQAGELKAGLALASNGPGYRAGTDANPCCQRCRLFAALLKVCLNE